MIQNQLSKILFKIVLVETETPGNLGAAARAMKTMGFTELRLVKPSGTDSREAIARAVSAEDVLHHATHFETLNEAIADCSLVFGTSGKVESLDQEKFSPRELSNRLIPMLASSISKGTVAIVFGRESCGLTLKELTLCNAQVRIPSDQDCPSLNLASAVQVICYELSEAISIHSKLTGYHPSSKSHQLATQAQLDVLFSQLESLALGVGALDPNNPRQMMRYLRQLYLRADPRAREINLMINLLKRANAKI